MKHFQNSEIIRNCVKLFENYSGFKIDFFQPEDFSSASLLPCAGKHCPQDNHCAVNPSQLKLNEHQEQYLIYPCPLHLKIIFIKIYVNRTLTSLMFLRERKNFKNDNRIADLCRFLYEGANYVFKFEFPLSKFSFKKESHNEELIKSVIRYINANYHQSKFSLKSAAQAHNVSYYHLSHLFKKHTGLSFIQFLNKLRIEKSIRLLNNPNLTISQVAYAAGFEDCSYFCRIFKRVNGSSPVNFRKILCARRKKTRAINL